MRLHRLFSLLLLIVAAACASGGRGEPPADRPRDAESAGDRTPTAEAGRATAAPTATAGSAPARTREIDEDRTLAVDAGAGTAQRRASQRVVEEGKGYLVAGRPRDAAQRFTRATQIDPTNGFAYYYLGRARVESGDRAGAVGVLQKAESLLGPYPEWRDRAARLLAQLK